MKNSRSDFQEESRNEFITEEKWQAIVNNDASYNNQFFYAVKTTGIFCKPSCKSRVPKKENVIIFQSATEAVDAQFRPCKRCKPTNERLPDSEWIEIITQYINKNYSEKLTLETLADISHGSPYHLQRTFKRIIGITPVEYIQQVRINSAINYLLQADRTVAEISKVVGIPNTPYFITVFKKIVGHTPEQFRKLQKMEEQ